MGAAIMLKTGAQGAVGTIENLRGVVTGALVTADGHARYQEAMLRGKLVHFSTGVAGVAPGTALSTTPPLVVWNPPNSGVVGVLLRSRFGYVSGTLGGGTIVYGYSVQVASPTGGTALAPTNGLLGATSGALKGFQGSTLTTAPTIVLPGPVMSAFLATTAVQAFLNALDENAGEIGIPPGIALALQGVAAAGTTPLAILGASFEEVPLNATT